MFKHMMEFLKQRTSLKKPFLEHYFSGLLKDLSNKDLVTLCGLLVIEMKNLKEDYMQLRGNLGSHNMKETKFSNRL